MIPTEIKGKLLKHICGIEAFTFPAVSLCPAVGVEGQHYTGVPGVGSDFFADTFDGPDSRTFGNGEWSNAPSNEVVTPWIKGGYFNITKDERDDVGIDPVFWTRRDLPMTDKTVELTMRSFSVPNGYASIGIGNTTVVSDIVTTTSVRGFVIRLENNGTVMFYVRTSASSLESYLLANSVNTNNIRLGLICTATSISATINGEVMQTITNTTATLRACICIRCAILTDPGAMRIQSVRVFDNQASTDNLSMPIHPRDFTMDGNILLNTRPVTFSNMPEAIVTHAFLIDQEGNQLCGAPVRPPRTIQTGEDLIFNPGDVRISFYT